MQDEEPQTQGTATQVDAEIGDFTNGGVATINVLPTLSIYDPNIALAGLAAGYREATRTT